jgi:DNA polymerase-3 subunit chi
MTRYDFYHLQKTPLEQVLPKLCEKAYATGKRIKILVGNDERVEFLNSLLWTYSEESFLPHGSKKDGFASEQPIFLSSTEDNENNAELLILVDGAMPGIDVLKTYERVLNIFDGNDDISLNNSRDYWKMIKSTDGELHYWQQKDNGSFEQKV